MAEGVVKELSDFLSNQIAAGEVVLRPASVVKELMENAVDAKAQVVIVNIKEGGIGMIQVVDDGTGMCYEDAMMAFTRHATSKISSVEDLFAIRTFGFRGEALPSIASISEVSLKSRMEDMEVGTLVEINGGKTIAHEECITPTGTQIMVKNLFYNIPARRKFLKSAKAEQRHIEAEFVRVALCYPRIAFFLHADGKCIYNLPTSNLRQRVNYIVGKTTGSGLMELHVDTSIVEIKGYVGNPKGAKKSAAHYMFINGRYFSHRGFHKAVQQAYQNLLPSNDMVPPYLLYFDISPDRIDVNVSPGKSEVKFDDEQSIWQILSAAVKESLAKNGIVPMIDFEAGDLMDIPLSGDDSQMQMPKIDTNPMFNPFDEGFSFSRAVAGGGDSFRDSIAQGEELGGSTQRYVSDLPSSSFTEITIVEDIKYEEDIPSTIFTIDQEQESYLEIDSTAGAATFDGENIILGNRYITTKMGGALVIIDSKRALYRIRYDAAMERIASGENMVSQSLLFPRSISLSMVDIPIIMDSKDEIEKLGLLFEQSGENTIEITALPSHIKEDQTEELVEEIITVLKDETLDQIKVEIDERIARSVAKSGASFDNSRMLSSEEANYITTSLMASSAMNYTPEGQSIIMTLTLNDIIKELKR